MTTPRSPDRYAAVHGTAGARPRMRALLMLMLPLFVGVAAGGYLVRAAFPWPALSPTQAGCLLVLLAAFLAMTVAGGRPRLEAFIKGAHGEEWIARILSLLPEDYTVFHGLPVRNAAEPDRRADIDHVVVGPTGVFVVETKNWAGPVSIADGRILYRGQEPDRPPLEQVRRAADALQARLREAGGESVSVQPVVCFRANAFAGGERGVGGTLVCDDRHLLAIIQEHTDGQLDESLHRRVLDYLRSQSGL